MTARRVDPVSPRVGCVDGEPMMHGPRPYRWCATHNDLMLRCESLRTPVSLVSVEAVARECAEKIVLSPGKPEGETAQEQMARHTAIITSVLVGSKNLRDET